MTVRRFIPALAPVLAGVLGLLSAGPALAQGGIDDLLNNIPTIENPEAEEEKPAEVPDVPFTTYVDQVRTQVLASWKPKAGTIKKNPSIETRLVLLIDESGQVQSLKPMVLSGDKKYDQSAVDAVNDAGDMPAPAPNLRTLAQEGVVVIFNGRAWLDGKK